MLRLVYSWVRNFITIYTELKNGTLNIAAIQILKKKKPSCLAYEDAKENCVKKWPYLLAVFFCVTHDGLSERGNTRSLHNVCITVVFEQGLKFSKIISKQQLLCTIKFAIPPK